MSTNPRLLIKAMTPPAIQKFLKRASAARPGKQQLFDGSDAMFKHILSSTKTYGEYGCGSSTEWVLANTQARVFAVDSSNDWIQTVIRATNSSDRLTAHHVDVGPIGPWGRPISYSQRANFVEYTEWIWEQEPKPEVVLIDGRFRVACFLTTLLRAKPATTIIFDDYLDRPHYHIVEELLQRAELCGRQCRFVVPEHDELDIAAITSLLERFRYVID